MDSWNNKVTNAQIADCARNFAFAYCDGDYNKQNDMFRDLMHEFKRWYNTGSFDAWCSGNFTTLK